MNQRIAELYRQAHLGTKDADGENPQYFSAEKFANLIIQECVAACDEIVVEADSMTKSKFVTDTGRMLHEGMWGGAQNCKAAILNRLGLDEHHC